VLNLIALLIGALAGWLPHLLFGDRLSVFADFMLGSIVGGIAYIVAIYRLKKMRGDF
jgi:hypothetical protein